MRTSSLVRRPDDRRPFPTVGPPVGTLLGSKGSGLSSLLEPASGSSSWILPCSTRSKAPARSPGRGSHHLGALVFEAHDDLITQVELIPEDEAFEDADVYVRGLLKRMRLQGALMHPLARELHQGGRLALPHLGRSARRAVRVSERAERSDVPDRRAGHPVRRAEEPRWLARVDRGEDLGAAGKPAGRSSASG